MRELCKGWALILRWVFKIPEMERENGTGKGLTVFVFACHGPLS